VVPKCVDFYSDRKSCYMKSTIIEHKKCLQMISKNAELSFSVLSHVLSYFSKCKDSFTHSFLKYFQDFFLSVSYSKLRKFV